MEANQLTSVYNSHANTSKEPETGTLRSPYRNISFSEQEILTKIHQKIDDCGTKTKEFVNANGSFIDFNVYCDNRSCTNPDCKTHRGYKFKKAHYQQTIVLQKSISSPKAWVFTGYVIPIDQLTKEYLSKLFLKLIRLLKQFSITEWSAHLEIKIKDPQNVYVHFHVVSGSINKLGLVRALWGRTIRYETAILPENLSGYISKYASKTPNFYNDDVKDFYALLVYKQKMHKFSPNVNALKVNDLPEILERTSDAVDWTALYLEYAIDKENPYVPPKPPPTPIKVKPVQNMERIYKQYQREKKESITQEYYSVDRLKSELKRSFRRGRPRDDWGTPRDYLPYVDDVCNPDSEIPSCIKIYRHQSDDGTNPTLGIRDGNPKPKKQSRIHLGESTTIPYTLTDVNDIKTISQKAQKLYCEESYPKTYLCQSLQCQADTTRGIGLVSKTPICPNCGQPCIGSEKKMEVQSALHPAQTLLNV